MTVSNVQDQSPNPFTCPDTAFVRAHWENLDPEMQEAMLANRLRLLRWMKRLLRAQTPDLGDGLVTVSACRVATQMFGT
jgi:hypothetical protein